MALDKQNPTDHEAYELEREVDALERRVIRDSLLIARRDLEMTAIFLRLCHRIRERGTENASQMTNSNL